MADKKPLVASITSVRELKEAVADLIRVLDIRLTNRFYSDPEEVVFRVDWQEIKERFGIEDKDADDQAHKRRK